MTDEILATVEASQPRRWTGVAMLMIVGMLVVYMAMSSPMAPAWKAFLIVVGVLALWMADRMRRATAYRLELTETELRSSEGITLARVEDVVSVERGMFAFKPSNGFLLTVSAKADRAWRPGIWWRLGRRIGIGGVTPASQTKMMSEILSAQIVTRDQDHSNAT